jgi:PAS domain S-box-containing protein
VNSPVKNKKKGADDDFEISAALKEIINSGDWYERLVETTSYGVMATDRNHQIVFVNEPLCDLLGYKEEEILENSILKIIAEDDRDKVIKQTERRYNERRSTQYEIRLKTKVGSQIPVLVSGSPIVGSQGVMLGTYAVFADIRERKIAEREVREKNAELQSLYNNLLELYEQLGNIIAETTQVYKEIYLFTSQHCVYCAPAEEVLQEVLASYGGKITYRKVDIAEEPDLAEKYDIMSLPTIVIGEEKLTSVPDAYKLHSALFSALVPEEKFRRTRQELDNIINYSPIVIMTINKEGLLTGINPKGEKMVKRPRKDVVGKRLFEGEDGKMDELFQTKIIDLMKECLSGKEMNIDRLEIKELDMDKPESFSILSIKGVPMTNKQGEVTEMLLLAEDVTEKAIKEKQLEHTLQQLEEVNDQLVRMNKERSNFVEVNTTNIVMPLRRSKELIDQILSGQLGEMNESTIGTMEFLRNNLVNVEQKVLDIIDFSSIESKGLTMEPESYALSELLSETLKRIGSIVIDKGFILKNEIEGDYCVWCDKEQILRVLKDIILNAIKFTNENCEVTVCAEESEDQLIDISIKDNGIGIKNEDLERIFEQYVKIDPQSSGSGLGLSVAKSIIEAHGGEIYAESSGLGKGSTFHVLLPNNRETFLKRKPKEN